MAVGEDSTHSVTRGDVDVLEMLTSTVDEQDTPPGAHDFYAGERQRPLASVSALRRPALDPLLLAASLSTNPNLTRHHFHHSFIDPSGEVRTDSRQKPRSERLREEAEAARAAERARNSAEAAGERMAPHVHRTHPPPAEEEPAGYPMTSMQAPVSVRKKRAEEARLRREQEAAAAPPPVETRAAAGAPAQGAPEAPLPPLEVRCMGRTRIPTPHGEIFCHLYRNNHDNKEHLALVADPAQNNEQIQQQQRAGQLGCPRQLRSHTLDAVWHADETPMERLVRGAYVGRLSPMDQHVSQAHGPLEHESTQDTYPAPLVRIHSECFTGETAGSQRCDCGEQLDEALRLICASSTRTSTGERMPPRGVIVYMRQEGRGIGLLDKLLAYNLQDMGHDTVAANVLLGHLPDARKYDISSAILRDLGVDACRLLTNNPEKMHALEAEGIKVRERVPMIPRVWQSAAAHHNHDNGRCGRCAARGPRDALLRQDLADTGSDVLSQPRSPSAASDVTSSEELDEHASASYHAHLLRRSGATLGGGSVTHGSDLDRYLRTKVEKMGHLLAVPQDARDEGEPRPQEAGVYDGAHAQAPGE